ncbi:MAG: TIGR03943 family protein [Xenococcaceae cyanobacterium]
MSLKFKIPNLKSKIILPWLDVLALLAWGALLLKYWVTGQLKLLIHPNYFWLVFVTSITLLILSGFKAWQLLEERRNRASESGQRQTVQHITLFAPGWGSGLLVVAAIVGFLIAPKVLTSQTALQRGVTESFPLTRSQPQAFRTSTKPEERSLIDWVRTLNAYPEPDAYTGQKAKVQGFVVHLPQLPDNYLLISRFVITCCAVDAYPVGIPVKLNQSRDAYPPDTWLEIEGEMIAQILPVEGTTTTETPSDKRQLILAANSLKKIPTPEDPYDY